MVLFFGLLRPYKGLDTLLEAWRGVRRRRAVDRGAPAHAARAAARGGRAGPERPLRVPRFVSDAELPAFFRRADIVVLPYSRTERFDWSGVLATALAFGKPTVRQRHRRLRRGRRGRRRPAGARPTIPARCGPRSSLLADPQAREGLAWGATATAAKGPTRGRRRQHETLALIATWFHSPP